MESTKTIVEVGHKELLDVLQIMHTMRRVEASKADPDIDEVMYLETVMYAILDNLDSNGNVCAVELDTEQRFAVWNCLDIYSTFIEDTSAHEEYLYCRTIMTAFGGMKDTKQTILKEADAIKTAFNEAADKWQVIDDPLGNDDHIDIVIDGVSHHLSFFATDMFQLFGSFIDEVIEVATENEW